MSKNGIVRTLGIVAIIIVAGIVGWIIFKLAIGLVAFLMFAMGGVVGFYFCRLISPSSKNNFKSNNEGLE